MMEKDEVIRGLTAALEGLLKFHEEDELGDGVPREMWAPEYREAVEEAEEMIKVVKGDEHANGSQSVS
jgi:hypothetical protein